MTYFDWLSMIAIPDGYKRADYIDLLLALHDVPFRWVVDRDENRAKDGLELRKMYEEDTGEWCDQYGPCTLLEMFLALAIRCDTEIMYDPDDLNRADKWFWMMAENLSMDKFISPFFVHDGKNEENFEFFEIVNGFLDRNYGQKWQFCPFFVPFLSTKLEKMELYYQMNFYLKWRFPTFFE